jgi:hypothetical protein
MLGIVKFHNLVLEIIMGLVLLFPLPKFFERNMKKLKFREVK